MTNASNEFLSKSKAVTFDVNLNVHNKVTLAALKDTQDNKNLNGPFNSIDELMESLNANN